jgi:phage-related protein
MKREIKIILLKEAQQFVDVQPNKVREKIVRTLNLVKMGMTDVSIFKKLEGTDIWEFRTEYGSNAYRLLSFWDKKKGAFVVATHGFLKKTQKTPRKEIAKAEAIMVEYYKK